MKISTSVTEMLGIDLPILGAPMFLVSYPDLVVAVSEAGGIGCFPSMNYRTVEELRDALTEIRSRTRRPIGVNLVLYKEHNPLWPKQLEVCLEFGVELLITSMGTPRTVVREARLCGARVFCDVTNLRQALLLAKAGADALIAVTHGAGGHAGTLSPFALIPLLARETGLPILAAGGISTGREMAAALSLGASGVSVGTRLIATPESGAKEEYKGMILRALPDEIVYTAEVSGVPANWHKESLERFRKMREEENAGEAGGGSPGPSASGKEGNGVLHDEMKKWRDIWSAGQGVGAIHEIKPAGDVIREMARDYEAIRTGLPEARG